MNTDLRSVDAEYRFGKPKIYLTLIEIARLTVMRSKLGDTRAERAAERIATAGPSSPKGGAQSN
jgi:hypothetical protein